MENRIFNAVCIFAFFVGLINAIINFTLGLVLYGLLMLPMLVIVLVCYYLSRYRNKLSIGVAITAFSFNLLCGGTYFGSAASDGVNLFTFILIIFILTLVCSKRQFWIWIPLNLLLMVVLITLEYHHPEWIDYIYHNKQHKLLDIAQTFFEICFMVILITLFMKKSYNREKELAQTRLIALEESNETKNKLFSIVAHDLKAPLVSIETYLSLLSQIELNNDEKVIMEKNLLTATRQTSEMLNNILLWSKDQMEGLTPNLIPINVHDTLDLTIQFQKSMAKEKGITLNYKADTAIMALADPDMLQLIVRNLLNNAIKFSSANGEIELAIAQKDQSCLIKIVDDGIGISTSKQQELFSLKSKSTYGTQNEKGVGLGLKLAKTYIELQHGKIWFESMEGRGTTFYVALPMP
ncbi:MAG: HAMP domain-containing sensor histidine kinase [Pedobacter sp.]|nr:HAMP domain-containing sensor histidine kinase [Pedobacter sp.]MDQ8054406.1 HAMP domain-containing sensor histidine kinase [Pedobacter sp.]